MVSALTLLGSLAAMFVPLTVANAAATGGYAVDGSVPDGGTLTFSDPSGGAVELGPENGSDTKVGVIHKADPPMLGYTNPNGNTDLRNVWLDTTVDAGKSWLYFAWERDAATGTSVISYEFQQAAKPTGCDYSGLEPVLIATCNPWSNRQSGDFIIVFDQQGTTVEISRRTFTGTGANLTLGPKVVLSSTQAAAASSPDGFRGEAALNLTDTVFTAAPSGTCLSVAHVLAGTVGGNSDSADYKDTVLAETSGIDISSCGSVEITKKTNPTGESGSFPVTLSRTGGGDVVYPSGKTASATLTGHDDVETIDDLREGTDYRLAESLPAGWELTSIVCGGVDVTKAPAAFTVTAGLTTKCVVTNKKQLPALTIEKTAAPTSFNASGAAIGYSYLVTNSGNVDLTGPVTLTDDKIASVSCPALAPDPVLSVGETLTCTATYTTTQADLDAGKVVNTAGAHAFYGATAVHSPTDDATVTATQTKTLSLDKTSSTVDYDAVGDVVSYSYLVKNTGNVTLAGPVTVDDDKTTVTCPAGGLAPLATTTCTATHTITQRELDDGSLTNLATASSNGVDSNEDSVRVPAVQGRTITLDKSSPTADYDAVGDVLTYSYAVKNTGNVTLAGPVAVADDKTTVTCPAGSLAPQATRTCSATHTVTQADLDAGEVVNRATATVNGIVSNQDTVTIHAVQDAKLTIDKTPTPTTYDAVGDVVTYSFLVTNSGNVTLSGPVTVADDKTTDEACPAAAGLAPGATVTCTASQRITQAHLDAGSITNTATASASFGAATVTSAPDTARVDAVQSRSLGLVKTPTPTTYDAVGDVIDYAYVLRNTGNVTLTGVFTVADDKTTVSCPTAAVSLAPGDVLTCTSTHTVTQADLDAGSITNLATASGGGVSSSQASATVDGVQSPRLSLTKTPSPLTYASVGQDIDYTYEVTNSGNVTLDGPFTVDDDKATTDCAADATLAPGSSLVCTATYDITQDDLDDGSVTNLATAYGEFEGAEVASVQVDATVDAIQDTGLTLVKKATPTNYDAVGDTIGYEYEVTNSGNVTLGGPFTVRDDKTGVTCPNTGSLAPTFSVTCTASYTVTQQDLDAGSVTNLAVATNGSVTSNEDAETVTAVQTKGLGIVKSATPTTYSASGQQVAYSYLVTNTGNVTLAGPFDVVDDKADATCPATASLAPGATVTCSAPYRVSQADMDAGSVTNVAYATGGGATSPTDTETVTAVQAPRLGLSKTADPQTYSAVGETISYDYVLENTGNVTLSGPFTVADDKTAVTCPGTAGVSPGATLTCTATTTITQAHLDAGSLTNTARAYATFGDTRVSSEPDSATVTAVQRPALGIDKSASPNTYRAVGELIGYSYDVTNTGNVTLTGPFTVADDKTGTSCPATASLAPGASVTCTASYAVTQPDLNAGSVTNVATASGGGVTSASDTETITAVQDPGLTVEKTPAPLTYSSVGQEIGYVYLVTNSGNVTLSGPFTVADDKTGTTCPATSSLAPGATLTCVATYLITQDDLDSGSVTNVATASGTHEGSPVTSAPDTARVEAAQANELSLVKTALADTYSTVGEVVEYTYLVTNTGNATLIGSFSVADDKTPVTCPSTSQLAPASALTCTASYAVTQADLDTGSVTNTAVGTATIEDPAAAGFVTTSATRTVTSNPDSETVTAVQTPALVLTKAADRPTFAGVGDVITYTYVTTNTGNVTLSGPFTVEDDKTPTTCPATESLAPGATLTCTASYAVTQADADAGAVTNVARATNGTTTSGPVSVTVTEEPVEVLPTVLTPPAAPAPAPAAAPAPGVQPRVLPFTGAWLLPMLALGSTMTLLGALLVAGARSRRPLTD